MVELIASVDEDRMFESFARSRAEQFDDWDAFVESLGNPMELHNIEACAQEKHKQVEGKSVGASVDSAAIIFVVADTHVG